MLGSAFTSVEGSQVACYGACVHTTEWDRDLLQKTLQKIMKHASLSQAAVGELAGRDRTMANRWLSGRHQPAYDAASRFANAITSHHPEIADLAEQFMAAAGYGERLATLNATTDLPGHSVTPSSPGSAGATTLARETLDSLRLRAKSENRSLGEVLIAEGLAEPEELIIPDSLWPDPFIVKINELDAPQEMKEEMIRAHLQNRARRFEEERLKRKRLDD